MNVVVDASMALAWIFERQKPEEAQLADQLLRSADEASWLAPSLLHLEVSNALLVGERRKVVTGAQVIDYLNRFDRLPIRIEGDGTPIKRSAIMALAREHGLSAYDATYLEVALRSSASLATFDAKLALAMTKAGGTLYSTV